MKKDLIEIKENSFFYKIKMFLRKKLFKTSNSQMKNISNNRIDSKINEEKRIEFCQGINNDLLDLKKKYHSGEIKSSDLSPEQIRELIKLYNQQNKELETSNELKKQKLLNHRTQMFQNSNKELLELQKKYHSGEIKSKELSVEQIKKLINLYNQQNKELEISNELKKQKLLEYREKIKSV